MNREDSGQPLVTLVVPAHNASATLERCIESLLAQTYSNLRIIIVVNACADSTEEVACRLAARDSRIEVVVTEETGVSHARNIGLEKSSGEYVGFADADDWVEPNMFEALVTVALELDADMVCCGWTVDSEKGSISRSVTDCVIRVAANDFYYGVLMGPYGGSVWNKLFLRSAIAGKMFDESMAIIEDSSFCCALVNDDLRFVAIPGCFYHYVSNRKSATHDISRLITQDGKWAYLEGALSIQSRAANEIQWRISEKVNCTFAASGVRELAGMAEFRGLHDELRQFLRPRLGSFIEVEPSGARVAKTMIALFAPRLWAFARRCMSSRHKSC